MTLPLASVAHHLGGRVRLRVPSARGNPQLARSIHGVLASAPGVIGVEVSPVSGSVLVLYTGDLKDVLRHAREGGAFVLGESSAQDRNPTERDDPPWMQLFDGFAQVDGRLRRESGGRWDVGSLAFYGLLGASAVQLRRGHLLPAASTLLMQAVGILRKLNREHRRG